jgi:hypothetical protein
MCTISAYPQERRRGDIGIPPHYVVQTACIPNRGFVAVSEARNHPATLPMLNLLIFNGEVVGLLFEVLERDGWKPWYDEPEGQAVSHDGGPKHYSQLIMLKQGPTAEECKAAKDAFGRHVK